jgi:nucleoside-diphosphate-sugar epimerase
MSLRAFVTGASGFVGMNLVRQLTEEGWEVTALVRAHSPLEDINKLGITLVEGNLVDAASVASAMPQNPDCVFHVAASTNIWSRNNAMQTRVNIDGTRNVLEAAIAKGARRLIHTSSFIVWGFGDGVLTEESPRLGNADWINYVRTKQAAESIIKQAVEERRIDAVILNPAHILGPGDRRNWSRMIRLVNDDDLPGVPPGGGAFSDVREVARAHIQAFHHGRKGHNYLLGGHDTMFIDVVGMTGDILGKKVPGRATPAWLLNIAAQAYVLAAAITGKEPDLTPEGSAMITRHIKCDSSKAIKELDYRFTPVRQLLQDTCEWMRDKGMLN